MILLLCECKWSNLQFCLLLYGEGTANTVGVMHPELLLHAVKISCCNTVNDEGRRVFSGFRIMKHAALSWAHWRKHSHGMNWSSKWQWHCWVGMRKWNTDCRFWLDNFLLHSVRAIRSVPGQRETCLDLVFTKTYEEILSFDRWHPLGNGDHLSLCFDYVCFSCPNPTDNRTDLVDNLSPLARSKRLQAKPWISRGIIAMQNQKKKLY